MTCRFRKLEFPDGWITLQCENGELCRECPDSDPTEEPKEETLPFRMIGADEFEK